MPVGLAMVTGSETTEGSGEGSAGRGSGDGGRSGECSAGGGSGVRAPARALGTRMLYSGMSLVMNDTLFASTVDKRHNESLAARELDRGHR
jgi:hypothetical protein